MFRYKKNGLTKTFLLMGGGTYVRLKNLKHQAKIERQEFRNFIFDRECNAPHLVLVSKYNTISPRKNNKINYIKKKKGRSVQQKMSYPLHDGRSL